MTDREVEAVRRQARGLTLRIGRRMRGMAPGVHSTGVRGQGLDFVGHRDYQPGDDFRTIDWNVAARQDRPAVKVFEHGFAASLMIVVDGSASMHVDDEAKWRRACEIAGLLGCLAAQESDRLGAIAVTADVESVLPLGAGPDRGELLMRWLQGFRPSARSTDLARGLAIARRLMRRAPGLIVVISDFLAPGWGEALRQTSRRFTVAAVRVVSPIEMELPAVGLVPLRDAENDRISWVDTGDAGVRTAYARRAAVRAREIRGRVNRSGAIPIDVRTSRAMVPQLRAICTRRRH